MSQLSAEVSSLAAERDALEREADQMQRDMREMAEQLQVRWAGVMLRRGWPAGGKLA